MKSQAPAESPDAYVNALTGWRKAVVTDLRAAALAVGGFEERIKWGHLVYLCNGPVFLIRAEEQRVLFGFWRGKLLRELDERLVPGGKYEMATIVFVEDDTVDSRTARKLIRAAVALNRTLGDPTAAARSNSKRPNKMRRLSRS